MVSAYPGLLDKSDVKLCMQAQLPQLPASHPAWSCTRLWDDDDLRMLQAYWIFIKARGHTGLECGPDWSMQKRRAQVSARLGSQRAPGDSKLGLDHLLPPGLGRELHMQQAKQQQNPFGNDLPLDTDILFAAEAMVRWGGSHRHVAAPPAHGTEEDTPSHGTTACRFRCVA